MLTTIRDYLQAANIEVLPVGSNMLELPRRSYLWGGMLKCERLPLGRYVEVRETTSGHTMASSLSSFFLVFVFFWGGEEPEALLSLTSCFFPFKFLFLHLGCFFFLSVRVSW